MVVAIFVTTIMAELASLNIFNTRLRESVLGGVPIELGLMTPGFINAFLPLDKRVLICTEAHSRFFPFPIRN